MNNQSRTLGLFGSLALLAVGCAPVGSDSPIRLLGARALTGTDTASCAPVDGVEQYAGNLDIAASTSYSMSFDKASDMEPLDIQVGGDVLAGPDRNDFFADQMLFSYTSTPALAFEDETQPVYFVIKAGEQGGWIRLNLIGPKAAAVLASLGRGDSVQLIATFTLSGALASGQRMKSNTIGFPIKVYNSGFVGCPAGDRLAPNGACGGPGGQDGAPVGCCSDPAFATACGTAAP